MQFQMQISVCCKERQGIFFFNVQYLHGLLLLERALSGKVLAVLWSGHPGGHVAPKAASSSAPDVARAVPPSLDKRAAVGGHVGVVPGAVPRGHGWKVGALLWHSRDVERLEHLHCLVLQNKHISYT